MGRISDSSGCVSLKVIAQVLDFISQNFLSANGTQCDVCIYVDTLTFFVILIKWTFSDDVSSRKLAHVISKLSHVGVKFLDAFVQPHSALDDPLRYVRHIRHGILHVRKGAA